ncbi:hypothetical protein [Paludibacterium purpuratum]|uniref:Uncharacterized protein n=1 Tax=Paludibacterium purpuratum TaxID=1144873 RepID=A0A4R7AZN0_9NEIS|nr:hypothetical protein [Paludibacterium purpuratum]TDR73872.1 hypothetical protein DFP86_11276 [Paludibacterium purpuratum]
MRHVVAAHGVTDMHLAHYVKAIVEDGIEHSWQQVERWQDQGFEVERAVAEYRFADGATIRRTVERDQFPSELACAECWISYEVLTHGAAQVAPAHKTFGNTCREAFWLRYHLADG